MKLIISSLVTMLVANSSANSVNGLRSTSSVLSQPSAQNDPSGTDTATINNFEINNALGTELQLSQITTYDAGSIYVSSVDGNNCGMRYTGPASSNKVFTVPSSCKLQGASNLSPNGVSVLGQLFEGAAFLIYTPTNQTYSSEKQLKKAVVQLDYQAGKNVPKVSTFFLQGDYTADQVNLYKKGANQVCNIDGETIYFNTRYCPSFGPTNLVCPSPSMDNINACYPTFNPGNGFAAELGQYTASPGEANTEYLTVHLKEVMFNRYTTGWNRVASSGAKVTTQTTSWSKSSSSSHNTTTSKAFQASMTEKLTLSEGFATSTTTLNTAYQQSVTHSTSSTISQTDSGSSSIECDPIPCDGVLYQWHVSATDSYGNGAVVQSCEFKCVPYTTKSPPRCPLGACSASSCQCCTEAWIDNNTDPTANHLTVAAGGTCTEPSQS